MHLETHQNRNASNAEHLGNIVWLFSNSKLHQSWSIRSIHQWVLPAIKHNQFLIYYERQKPVGVVTWAMLSKEVEKKFALNTRSLHPNDWQSGDQLWGLDFIAPFGHAKDILKDLKNNQFTSVSGKFLRAKKDDDTLRIMYAHGSQCERSASTQPIHSGVL